LNGRPLRVIVVGGGIGGLTTGVLLAKGGADVTLLDQGDSSGRGAALLLLQPNGLAVLRALGLDQKLEAAGRRVDMRDLHGRRGQLLGSLRMPRLRCRARPRVVCASRVPCSSCSRRPLLITEPPTYEKGKVSWS
jgi:2-polyprenyl-6-methoxyphenol hydroxylase-like FAD-dependent oxidoreductase